MKKNIFKRIATLAMAAVMCLSMAVSASAVEADSTSTTATYGVTIYKEGSTTTKSMANDIVDGDATVTTTDSSVVISIPIQPIIGYAPMGFLSKADGYLRTLTVTGATSATVEASDTFYTDATLTIVMPAGTTIASGTTLSVSTSHIDLYKTGTQTAYTLITHISPAFDIVLN